MAVGVGWGVAVEMEARAVPISSLTMRLTSCSEVRQPAHRIDIPETRARNTPGLKKVAANHITVGVLVGGPRLADPISIQVRLPVYCLDQTVSKTPDLPVRY